MTRKLYPYWDEIFESIGGLDNLLSDLGTHNLPAALYRPPDPLQATDKETYNVRKDIILEHPDFIQTRFQMTIRPKVRLTPKHSSLLLTVCTVRALHLGIDLPLYLTMSYLLEICERDLHRSSDNVNKEKTARAVCLAELTLLSMEEGEWKSLVSKTPIQKGVVKVIEKTGWLPSHRTWNSWKEKYEPEKLLELRIVPLEEHLERTSGTERYSSYTKGYHESGRGYRRDGKVYGQDVGPRAEIGIANYPDGFENFVHPLERDPIYQRIRDLIFRAKLMKKQRK